MKCWSLSHLFCNPMDCSPPASSVHGILQARILDWVAIPFFSRGASRPRDWIQVSRIALQADSLPSEPQGKPFPQIWLRAVSAKMFIIVSKAPWLHCGQRGRLWPVECVLESWPPVFPWELSSKLRDSHTRDRLRYVSRLRGRRSKSPPYNEGKESSAFQPPPAALPRPLCPGLHGTRTAAGAPCPPRVFWAEICS